MQAICSIPDCAEPHYGKSYCRLHFRRWKKTGDPLAGARTKNTSRCAVDGCERIQVARGWCLPCYKRWQRWGTPTPTPLTVEERFFSHVTEHADGCWIWDYTGTGGYGTYFFPDGADSYLHPHRWAYEHLRCEIPTKLVIDHLCENRACVNPWHLEPVTQQINILRARRREASERQPP